MPTSFAVTTNKCDADWRSKSTNGIKYIYLYYIFYKNI